MAAPTSTLHRYLLGVLIILLTCLTRALMAPLWETTAPFALFGLAVAATAWFAGRGPTVVVAIASLAIRAVFDFHTGSLATGPSWEEAVRRLLFLAFVAGTIVVSERLRANARELETSLELARREIAERERIETELVAARLRAEEANRLKDEFLAMVSHELRTPLNAILGWATLLRSNTLAPRHADHAMAVIDRNARHQAQLIGDLLDVARSLSGRLLLESTCVDLAPAIEAAVRAVEPTAAAKPVTLTCAIAARPLPVWGDASRLQQVAWNLVSNAVKFTPRGGQVHVTVGSVRDFVQFTVTDTGAGIAPEFLPHVFDRFAVADAGATRAHGGLGLGLTLVRQLIELHGGSIEARSDGVNRGSRFTVTLPLHAADRDPDDLPARIAPVPVGLPE